jgi:nitric oxide reductase NorE protein
MRQGKRVVGEPGIWILILGDLPIFTAFFLIFAWYRHQQPRLFAATSQLLNHNLGLTNTLILLTGSVFVALGVRRVRDRAVASSGIFLAAAMCGIGSVAIKVFEYAEKVRGSHPLAGNDFFTLYFAFTGVHLLHVIFGTCVLIAMTLAARAPNPADNLLLIECGATFWHLVDLLWLVLFALFYLIG